MNERIVRSRGGCLQLQLVSSGFRAASRAMMIRVHQGRKGAKWEVYNTAAYARGGTQKARESCAFTPRITSSVFGIQRPRDAIGDFFIAFVGQGEPMKSAF